MTLKRIQLRRKKGWRMPENTVKVDRSTPWGNPFIVGKHGTTEECVLKYITLMTGNICLSDDNYEQQKEHFHFVKNNIKDMEGKNLACWCSLKKPCHANLQLIMANTYKGFKLRSLLIEFVMARLKRVAIATKTHTINLSHYD